MLNKTLQESSFSLENTPSSLSKSMFYYVQSCGHFHCTAQYFTERKEYNSFLLLYTLKGIGQIKYRGKALTVSRGDIFLIDCNEYQYYNSDPKELWEFTYIHFNGSESKYYFDRIIENGTLAAKLPPDSIIPSNIDRIIDMCMNRNSDLDIRTSCFIVEILTELLLCSISHPYRDNMPSYLLEALKIVELTYNKKLSLDDIAKQVNVNKFHLTRQFKKYLGQSLYEYILNFRFTKSKELLKTTQLSIAEISEKVGFESVSHFVKIFKQNESTTPLRFRKYWT